MTDRMLRIAVFSILIAMLVLPPVTAALLLLSIPAVSPEQAAQSRQRSPEDTIILDVRPRQEFQRLRLKGTINVPLEELGQDRPRLDSLLEGKRYIFALCDAGFLSARAVRTLQALGYTRVENIRGGLDAWLGGDLEASDKRVITPLGETDGAAHAELPVPEQLAISTAAFVIKPIYLILSVIIIAMLWKREEIEYIVLKWAVLAFYLGETACGLNYLVFDERSLLMEYLHMYGMVLCFGMVVFALTETFDRHLLHYSQGHKKCALLPLCGGCYKYGGGSCNLRLFFLFAIPACAVLTGMPLTAKLGSAFVSGSVFGHTVVFGQPMAYQFVELRLFPLTALVLFAASFLLLLADRENGFDASKQFFAMAMGPLGFSLLRFICFSGYRPNPLWGDFWEEATELLFISALVYVLLRMRKGAG